MQVLKKKINSRKYRTQLNSNESSRRSKRLICELLKSFIVVESNLLIKTEFLSLSVY
jgi:hypothetical protein